MPAQRNIPSTSPPAKPYSRQDTDKGLDNSADEMRSGSKSKSLNRPRRSNNKEIVVYSDNSGTPALSFNGSVDNDYSSDYAPHVETPSKPGKTNANSLYVFEDDDDDIKPDLSDDEISYPGIVADIHREESDDESNYGKKGGKGKGKAKGNVKNTPKKVTPRKAGSSVGGSGKKPGVAWMPQEDWMLFQQMHPKTSKPNWQDIANSVQRDAKVSCISHVCLTSSHVRTGTPYCRRG